MWDWDLKVKEFHIGNIYCLVGQDMDNKYFMAAFNLII